MKPIPIEKDLLTLNQVMKMHGLSRSTLWRWYTYHGLPVIKVGSWTRIRKSALEQWLKEREQC